MYITTVVIVMYCKSMYVYMVMQITTIHMYEYIIMFTVSKVQCI